MFEFESLLGSNLTDRITGSPDHQIVTNIQILYSFVLGLFSLSGFLISKKYNNSKNNKVFLICLIATTLFGAIIPYGGEIVMRVFLLNLIFLSYYISYNFNHKTTSVILIIFLVVVSPFLNIISHYGTEEYQYISQGESIGAEFLYDRTISGEIICGFPWGLYKNSPDIYIPALWRESWNFSEFKEKLISYRSRNENSYLILGRGEETKYHLYCNTTHEEFQNLYQSINSLIIYNKVYNNNDFNIYCSYFY